MKKKLAAKSNEVTGLLVNKIAMQRVTVVYLRSTRMAKDDRTNTAERAVCDIATSSALKIIAVDSFTNLNTLSHKPLIAVCYHSVYSSVYAQSGHVNYFFWRKRFWRKHLWWTTSFQYCNFFSNCFFIWLK